MLMLILGFFGVVFFSFLAVVTLNYSIYLWENERINNLASQVKRKKVDELLARRKEKGFTAKDLNKNLHYPQNSSDKEGGISYDKNLKNIFTLNGINSFAKQIFKSVKQLTKPPKNDYYDPLAESKLREIKEGDSKISDENRIDDIFYNNSISFGEEEVGGENYENNYENNFNLKNKPKTSNFKPSKEPKINIVNRTKPLENVANHFDFLQDDIEEQREFEEQTISETEVGDEENYDFEDENSGATLNFAANESQQKRNRQSLFKKMEDSILEKLKEKGLNHYDIWLELAQLYEKYGQQKKAVEVYSMILKHSKSKEKIIARNKLIALT